MEVEDLEFLAGKIDGRKPGGGNHVAIGNRRRIAIERKAAIAAGLQKFAGIAGMLPVVEQSGARQCQGGGADRGYRNARCDKLTRFFDSLEVATALPGVATGKDEQGTF